MLYGNAVSEKVNAPQTLAQYHSLLDEGNGAEDAERNIGDSCWRDASHLLIQSFSVSNLLEETCFHLHNVAIVKGSADHILLDTSKEHCLLHYCHKLG